LGREHPVFGLAGIYRNQDGGVLLLNPPPPGRLLAKMRWMNAALTELCWPARLKPTYLGSAAPGPAGGALPHSPLRSRHHPGEDTDYILNARLFGIPFFLDHTLSIIHLRRTSPIPPG